MPDSRMSTCTMTDKPSNTSLPPDARSATMGVQSGAGNPRFWVLIPCAGSGARAGGDLAKQYRRIAGQALVSHTLAAFCGVARISRTLVLLAPGDTEFATLGLMAHCVSVECGAPTRAGTVTNGLSAVRALGAQDHDWVLVHDAARCLVTPELIDRLIDACGGDAVGGLLAVPVSDTLKLAAGGRVAVTVDRNLHWLAQTPQMFRLRTLEMAFLRVGDAVTDEACAVEALGLSPKLVPGDASNFKVTYPQDFTMAQAILLSRQSKRAKERTYDYP